MQYTIKYTSQFKKDVKLAKKQNKPMNELFNVIDRLSRKENLEEKYKLHSLAGNYIGCFECHIQPDWLLIFKYVESDLILLMNRIGSHSDLF